MRQVFLTLLLVAGAVAQDSVGQAFRLEPGEYRWVPFTVKQVPSEVTCRFEVMRGEPSVHLELLPMRDFRLFTHGREHETLAMTGRGASGTFRRMLAEPGQYAVLAINDGGAPVAVVSLEVNTDASPAAAGMARELPAGRRLAVILISFGIFFASVTYSGVKLLRAMKM